MEFLRNLPVDHPEELAGLIEIRPGRVVSMALSRSEHCQMTLLAFGDGENDIPMLVKAGVGVAVANAKDNVKAAADYIAPSVDEDGVAEALRHFGVIA